ncbi:hypothetical protein H0H93_016486 [Arthromyces matolae]|nr:hypothetical protein H0H93_016486 [Arthromyces matolae]
MMFGMPVLACTDRNDDGQQWYAEHVKGDDWKLRCKRRMSGSEDGAHVYLAVHKLARKEYVWALEGNHNKWTITQYETDGGADYRLWLAGAPSETVLDLENSSNAENTFILAWENLYGVNQLWLFEEVPTSRFPLRDALPNSAAEKL